MDDDEPVDLTGPDWHNLLGLPRDAELPPPGMTYDEVAAQVAALVPWNCVLEAGDRVELMVDAIVGFMWAEFMTDGTSGLIPAGTVFELNSRPVESAIGFVCRPRDPDAVALSLYPNSPRKRETIVQAGFGATFLKAHVGHYLRLLN